MQYLKIWIENYMGYFSCTIWEVLSPLLRLHTCNQKKWNC